MLPTRWLRNIMLVAVALAACCGSSRSWAAPTPATNLVRLAAPQYNAAKDAFSVPAAFWNEHLTNWLDVAVCGRPSNFLHETILSIQTTRTIIRQAMHNIGFKDADAWAPNFQDFLKIRGQPLLILITVKRHGKRQIFPLDELIAFQQWNIAIGPMGWIYLGTPAAQAPALHARTYQPGQLADPNAILVDDPQIAMQFRGIQSASQTLVDNPLCFDGWIYPNIRYFRNTAVLPRKVYNSNGAVPARLTFCRVSAVRYLKTTAQYWHNPPFAKYMLAHLPIAHRIDKARADLWRLTHTLHKHWTTSTAVQEDVAAIAAGNAALDAAWINWDYQHARFGPGSPATISAIKARAQLFHQYMNQRRARFAQLLIAAQAARKLALLKKHSPHPTAAVMAHLQAQDLAAHSKALLLKNQQDLQMWTAKVKGLSPHDPRKQWIKDVHAEYNLALARQRLGQAGIAYAHAMAHLPPAQWATAQNAYLRAILGTTLAQTTVRLVGIEFEISTRKGFASKAEMAKLAERQAALKSLLKNIRARMAQIK